MELERMRRVLAEGMGWIAVDTKFGAAWNRPSGHTVMMAAVWQPDVNWRQCGIVIEMMREQGWRCEIYMASSGYYARVYRPAFIGRYDGRSKSFPKAVSLAAACALESEATE